jgi:hypothetical protein
MYDLCDIKYYSLSVSIFYMSWCEAISHCAAGVGSNYVTAWVFFTLVEIAFFAENT